MKLGKYLIASLALLGMQTAAQAEDWKPAGPWAADYGDESCRLLRGFTNGKDEVVLTMERTQPYQFFRVIFIGDGIKTFRGAQTVEMTFAPGGRGQEARMMRSRTADDKQYLDLGLTTVVPPAPPGPNGAPGFKPYDKGEELAAGKSINSVELTSGLVTPATFETGSLEAPMGALQACVSDLIASWGLDAKAHESLRRPVFPQGPASDWIPANSFPFTEFNKFLAGLNSYRVMVDAEGKATDCVVLKPALAADINSKVCEGIKSKGKFMPALDGSGQPIASFWIADPFALMPPMGGPGGGRR